MWDKDCLPKRVQSGVVSNRATNMPRYFGGACFAFSLHVFLVASHLVILLFALS